MGVWWCIRTVKPGRATNFGDDAIQVLEDIDVPVTNDPIAVTQQHCRPLFVENHLGLKAMLAAIEFDDKFCPVACEVRDCTANRNLTAEMIPIGLQES